MIHDESGGSEGTSDQARQHVAGDAKKRAKRRGGLLRWWDHTSESLRRKIKPLLKPLYRRFQIRSVIAWFVPGWGEVSKSPGGAALVGNLRPGHSTAPLIAAVGDFGSGKEPAFDVAQLIAAEGAQAVVTLGDNVYYQTGYQALVGNLYGEYLEAGAFFPATGNHDYSEGRGIALFDRYFDFLGGHRWYRVTLGPFEFFMLDSHQALHHPDIFTEQYDWLEAALADSTAQWKAVVVHHPPHSARSRSQKEFRFPYDKWGVDMVLSGHDHTMQHLEFDGVHYIVDGVGGGSLHKFEELLEGTQYRLAGRYGAFFMRPTDTGLHCYFKTTEGDVVHEFEIAATSPAATSAPTR
ncbi:metallophosphoesterase [Pontimonas sp.]|jgi:predicted phosphodiesterase|uniref:metallophosphoesterase family protein n=1 Tax=Pontimonas sp. TaxID=2304492 RepID=UPI00286FF260|nr:metallophosphoesterase [Pontimonas sp.]MDR9434854.1 metallophosphoesterase [Pontimonas sp.]